MPRGKKREAKAPPTEEPEVEPKKTKVTSTVKERHPAGTMEAGVEPCGEAASSENRVNAERSGIAATQNEERVLQETPDFNLMKHYDCAEDRVARFDSDGFNLNPELRYVRLTDIKFKAWAPQRLNKCRERLLEVATTEPVVLGAVDDDTRLHVRDGNHRCTAAQERGYTSIAAVVLNAERVEEPPYGADEMKRYRELNRLYDLHDAIKRDLKTDSANAISFKWNPVEQGFTVILHTEIEKTAEIGWGATKKAIVEALL
eukprot:m.18375 g.18375  ORF g.18375 m.18375 type:complete len:259 (-) comp5309_c0_seq2:57-833(-)